MNSFLKSQFDKLMLLGILLVFCILTVHFSHHTSDGKALDFSLQAASGVLGAIITLLQTSRRRDDPDTTTTTATIQSTTVEKTGEPVKEKKESA